jgi:flagellar biosynthesis/type III secretory pathway protein FliH
VRETGSATQSGPTGRGASGRIEVFEYAVSPAAPSLPALEGWGPVAPEEASIPDAVAQSAPVGTSAAGEAELRAGFDRRLGEETRRAFEAGRERGLEEGRQSERGVQAAAMADAEQRRARQIAELMEKFARERDSYLHAVEPEVVQLALAVAARILRREAQMDPLLLTGAVRVALGQLAGSTKVKLRVPPADLDLWTEAMQLVPNLAVKPTVLPGEGMRLGDCTIETRLGSVDLGIRSQIGEIERGFFDRAGRGKRAAEIAAPVAAVHAADNAAMDGQGATEEVHR